MKKNMGTVDRVVRVLIAIVILSLYFSNVLSGTTAIVLLAISGIFMLTSMIGFCPLYWPLGIRTCKS